MSILKPTSQQIKEYRDHYQCSLQEAKLKLMKEWRCEMLELAGIQIQIGSDSSAIGTIVDYLKAIENST